jgi:hypothetical protein
MTRFISAAVQYQLETIMHRDAFIRGSRTLAAAGICLLSFSTGGHFDAAQAQEALAPNKSASLSSVAPAHKLVYYVDFRARTAQSYGHAFTWYGRSDQKQIEVAGLHPATDSVVPYIMGHVIPVPAETGKSYGDLDPQYLTASYRVFMDEAQAKRVFGYIKHLQASSPLWNAATYNCVAFIQDIARYMGLRVPGNHLLYPEDWVNQLRALNGGTKFGRMPSAPGEQAAAAPSAPAPSVRAESARSRSSQKPVAPDHAARKPAAGAQTAEMSPRVDQFRLMD